MSNYQGVVSDERNHNGDETFMRDIHALTPSSILPPQVHHPFGTYLSMSTSDRDDFSTTSVDNSTLVVAGSVVGSVRVESDSGTSNRMIIGEQYERVDGMLHISFLICLMYL